MILRLSRTTAELVGEAAEEWQTLEKVARLGQWASGPRADEARLRKLASKVGVPLRVEGITVLPTPFLVRSQQLMRRRGAP